MGSDFFGHSEFSNFWYYSILFYFFFCQDSKELTILFTNYIQQEVVQTENKTHSCYKHTKGRSKTYFK